MTTYTGEFGGKFIFWSKNNQYKTKIINFRPALGWLKPVVVLITVSAEGRVEQQKLN